MTSDFSKGAAWIDGNLLPVSEAKIGVTDWGLVHSDITYDVVHVWDGAFFRLNDHLDRFEASLAKSRLSIPQSRDEIAQILHQIVAASGLRAAYCAFVASRGVPVIQGSRDPRDCRNHFYAWAVPFIHVLAPDVVERGARLKVAKSVERISPCAVDPTAKNYHWGDMTAALFEALEEGFDSAVLSDINGHITEGPGFNVFCVIDGIVYTPRSGVLEGITRKSVFEICAELGHECVATDIERDRFIAADEVFIATSGGGPVPVTRVDQHILNNDAPGPFASAIRDRYWEWHKRGYLCTPVIYHDGDDGP